MAQNQHIQSRTYTACLSHGNASSEMTLTDDFDLLNEKWHKTSLFNVTFRAAYSPMFLTMTLTLSFDLLNAKWHKTSLFNVGHIQHVFLMQPHLLR